MKVYALLLFVVVACALEQVIEESPLENESVTSSGHRPPFKNCLIHYECKHYKWFCYRSEHAFCIGGTCKCLPRYHFGYRHRYRMYQD
ncbi:unnamed protein product [Pieris macdunnoughi]|uniref:Uncharacterized protein n=1 Tax=Pieris macdunnoughi TaxID=345717 RepID=A0A821Q1S5_9NEOP|nr:unnamed protein product [Pieris macdunnoughi]